MKYLKRIPTMSFCLALLIFQLYTLDVYGQSGPSPLQFFEEQEIKNKDTRGEVYLGKVMTLTYPAFRLDPSKKYYSILMELTDALKTPVRENYRLLLKGFTDNRGTTEANVALSRKRAEHLKAVLIQKYSMTEERITAEGPGAIDPV
ncbi:MAG: OmpA family protein, partial [Desulfatiglandales bacterium]